MDKFCLKWNDFQTSVTNSFSKLRKEDELYDVTLITDDDQFIRGHKLVLASSSDFFKRIFKVTKQAESIIYLTGINQKNLSFIMDYIYLGEVQIFQEEIDSFLESAKKLRIEGLISDQTNNDFSEESNSTMMEPMSCEEKEQDENATKNDLKVMVPTRTRSNHHTNSKSKDAVNKLIMRDGDVWVCKPCGQTAKNGSSIRLHAERHIVGISFDCQICDKSFRSRNSLAVHKSQQHK